MYKNKKCYGLKDCGKREQYRNGAQREVRIGKGRFDLISPIMEMRLALLMEKGTYKYAANNWTRGIPVSRFIDAAKRHICQYVLGLRDEDHLTQSIFNLMGAIYTETMVQLGKLPKELSDLPVFVDNPELIKDILGKENIEDTIRLANKDKK